MREFATGATRDSDKTFDPEGFMSPLVIQRYCQYMEKHRVQADGKVRTSDNWTKGIPKDAYIKSAWRHFMDWWLDHRGHAYLVPGELDESLCALMFNVQGYLFEVLRGTEDVERCRHSIGSRDSYVSCTYPNKHEGAHSWDERWDNLPYWWKADTEFNVCAARSEEVEKKPKRCQFSPNHEGKHSWEYIER